MRNPIRGEADAFYIAFGAAALIGVSAVLGALVDPIAGVALFVAGVIAALVWDTRTKDPDRRRALREAAAQGARRLRARARARDRQPHAGLRRAASRAALRAPQRDSSCTSSRRSSPRARTTSPPTSTLSCETRACGSTMRSPGRAPRGCAPMGRVGDPNQELGAIEDELRLYGADEVIISTLAPGKSNWLETGIVERLREELEIPVTHLVAETEPSPAPAGG